MTEYQNLFFNAVKNILNSNNETFPSNNIRFAYQEMGQPFFNRGETYVYIDLFETDFDTNRHIDKNKKGFQKRKSFFNSKYSFPNVDKRTN